MEVDPERATTRPAPELAPPLEPGAGPSVQGLALIARIMQAEELAADAAGIPPLDSDQVLDLQKSAGNRLTEQALLRWTEPLADFFDA